MQRRHFIQSTGALALTLGLPRPVRASQGLEFGTTRIDVVSDGHLVLPPDFALPDGDEEELRALIERYDLSDDVYEPPCNLALIRDGSRTLLFDVGAGPDFMSSAGHMAEALDALGVTPDDITHLVVTHAHPDHIWGMLDDFDDPLLPNAEVLIGRAEFDYWMDPDTLDTIGEARQSFAVGAQRRLSVIEDRVQLFEDGAEILPGIQAVASFGHTPGHMAFELRAGGHGLMIVGDALSTPHFAFERPLWPSDSDQQPDVAAATRARLLDRITVDDLMILGFHFSDGGIGRAERRAEDRYVFTAGV